MLSNYDGDIKLFDVGIGSDIEIVNGQPTLDEGLENAVYISMFSSSGWWGNAVSTEAESHNSELENLMTENLTNALRLEIEESVRDCLAWMVTEGVAKSVDAEATIPEPDMLTLTVTIEQPEGTKTLKYNLNWSAMRGRVGV